MAKVSKKSVEENSKKKGSKKSSTKKKSTIKKDSVKVEEAKKGQVKKSQVRRETIKKKNNIHTEDEEPGFKEYAIIILGVFLVCFGLYYAFELFYEVDERSGKKNNRVYEEAGIFDEGFVYEYKPYSGKTVNVKFVYDLTSLEKFDFTQELTEEWLKSYEKIIVLTPPALENLSENALLIKSNGKFALFLKHAIGLELNESNFASIGRSEFSCENASLDMGIITFNYYGEEYGVIQDVNKSNCMSINTNEDSLGFVQAVDKIMYDIVIKG